MTHKEYLTNEIVSKYCTDRFELAHRAIHLAHTRISRGEEVRMTPLIGELRKQMVNSSEITQETDG